MSPSASAGPAREARPYRSSARAAQARRTRERILAAAAAAFRCSGFAGTTMGGVALAAGVSVQTVELSFGTKAALLKAAIDVAIAGDDEPVAVLERPWAGRASALVTADAFLAAVAEVLVEAARRADALVATAIEASRGDERLEPLARQLRQQRAVTAAWIVDGLVSRAPLRPGVERDAAVDVVWALMDPAVFLGLTTGRGWTAERFGDWFADSVRRLLLASPEQR